MKALAGFKNAMKPYRLLSRTSTVSNAFAQALAPSDVFDEARLIAAFSALGLVNGSVLNCAYCDKVATSVDHLNPLVVDKKFSGWGHVFGNLVPACGDCNQSKGGKPWRDFVQKSELGVERIQKLEDYEKQAPRPVSQAELESLYPYLLDAYERLRNLSEELFRAAQSVANEIQKLEGQRKAG